MSEYVYNKKKSKQQTINFVMLMSEAVVSSATFFGFWMIYKNYNKNS